MVICNLFIQIENIEYNEALVRLFVEVLCNSIDNVWRSKEKNIEQKIINRPSGQTMMAAAIEYVEYAERVIDEINGVQS